MVFSNAMDPRNCHKKTAIAEGQEQCPFFQCAHLILPWLTPSELANTAPTCTTLFRISESITRCRSLDASRSLEYFPIPFHNSFDDIPYAYFIYTPSQLIASSESKSLRRQFWDSSFDVKLKPDLPSQVGLDVVSQSRAGLPLLVADPVRNSKELSPLVEESVSGGSLDSVTDTGPFSMGPNQFISKRAILLGARPLNPLDCPRPVSEKLSRNGVNPVNLVDELGETVSGCECEKCLEVGNDTNQLFGCPCFSGLEELGIVNECGPSCGCGLECQKRLTQRGIPVRLKIMRDMKKGWGLYADQLIRQGQFICEYAGELLTTEEARWRQQIYDELASRDGTSSALLVVREHLPSGKACLRINIDATRIGNIARFINHSCDGGNLSTVLVRSSGALLPRLCFFASKDIKEGEELSFSYGEIRVRSNGLSCFCGSSCCFGILPSEHT